MIYFYAVKCRTVVLFMIDLLILSLYLISLLNLVGEWMFLASSYVTCVYNKECRWPPQLYTCLYLHPGLDPGSYIYTTPRLRCNNI